MAWIVEFDLGLGTCRQLDYLYYYYYYYYFLEKLTIIGEIPNVHACARRGEARQRVAPRDLVVALVHSRHMQTVKKHFH